MKPITPEELQFLYNILLDRCQLTMRDSLAAHDIMQRLAIQLTTQEQTHNDNPADSSNP
jgi:hypothetical protein